MDCSMPGFLVHHQLLELAQTHFHWVGDAIQASHPLLSPSPAFHLSQHQGLFQWVSSLHHVAKVLEFQWQCIVVVIMVITIIVVCSICCVFLLCCHSKCFMCTSSTNPYTNFITTVKYHSTNGGGNLGRNHLSTLQRLCSECAEVKPLPWKDKGVFECFHTTSTSSKSKTYFEIVFPQESHLPLPWKDQHAFWSYQ